MAHLDPFPSSCLNILDVSWLSVLKPDSPGCQVAACLLEWCCHSSLDPGTGLVCDTSGVWMCGTTMVWYVCMVWYVVCVPIVLLSTPQAPILRPNTKPYSTYWCIMPIPCTFSIWATLHGLPLSPNHLASSSQPELYEVPAEQHDDVRLHHSGMPSVGHHRRGVSCQIVDEMGYLFWFDLFDCCLITSVLPVSTSASSNKIPGGGVHDPTEVGNFGALLDARAQF